MNDIRNGLIERVAEEFYNWQTGTTGKFVASIYRDNWVRGTGRALAAAGLVQPTSSRPTDEVKLAEVIRQADAEWQIRESRLETASPLTHGQYVARAVTEWLEGGA